MTTGKGADISNWTQNLHSMVRACRHMHIMQWKHYQAMLAITAYRKPIKPNPNRNINHAYISGSNTEFSTSYHNVEMQFAHGPRPYHQTLPSALLTNCRHPVSMWFTISLASGKTGWASFIFSFTFKIILILECVIAELNEELTDTTDATSPPSSPLFCGVVSEVSCSTSATSPECIEQIRALCQMGSCINDSVDKLHSPLCLQTEDLALIIIFGSYIRMWSDGRNDLSLKFCLFAWAQGLDTVKWSAHFSGRDSN